MKTPNIEQVLGHAMLNADFREQLFSDPENCGREAGLNEADIAFLKRMDRKTFAAFKDKLSNQLMKNASVVIFCGNTV
jgi:hypothetical protein